MSKGGKMLQWINYRVRVTLNDGRQMVGNFLAFDKFEISCSLKIKPRQVLTVVRRKGQRGPCIPLTSEVAKICLFWDLLGKYCML